MPAPRRPSFTSSSLNGFTMAVTRWITGPPRTFVVGGRAGTRARRSLPADGLGDGRPGRDAHGGRRRPRTEKCRVGHALAELHVVGGRAVLVQVHALELAVLADPQRLRRLDPVHHDDRNRTHGEDAGDAPDELGLELVDTTAVQEA